MIEEFKNAKEVQMVVFRLADEEYAVPIINVQEIIMPQAATKIPKAPGFIEGIINLRGKIISVIDGKKKFQLEQTDRNKANERIIVLDIEHEIIGLIVDEVKEVIHLNTEDIELPPMELDEEKNFIMGVGKFQNRLLILIKPHKFLSMDEVHDLKKMSEFTEKLKPAA